MKNILIVFFFYQSFLVFCQADTSQFNPINDDTYLHPVDGTTPYTFKKGECFYAQSLQTFPGPGWAFVGVTESLTLQLDFTPLIGGLFLKPHYPIPSISARYKVMEQKKTRPAMSVEAQFFHLWDTLKRFDIKDYTLYQKGSYFHLKTMYGYKFGSFYINGSLGFDYMNNMWWVRDQFSAYNLSRKINPNFSFGMSWRASHWISYHLAFTYGSTLTYFENVPRKLQFNYGMRVALFYKNKWRILRNMRVELISINSWFRDIGEYSGIPLPVYPLFYWQWQGKNRSGN